jgi:hypothetical protein
MLNTERLTLQKPGIDLKEGLIHSNVKENQRSSGLNPGTASATGSWTFMN